MCFAPVGVISPARLVRLGLLVQRAAFSRHRFQGHAKRHRTGSAQDCDQSPEYGFTRFDMTRDDCGDLDREASVPRIAHHLRLSRRPHWHIDYLRAHTRVEESWYCLDDQRLEHIWAKRIGLAEG